MSSAEEVTEFEMDGMTMKRYYLLLYVRGDRANEYSEEELEKIQAGHLAHIKKLASEGKVLMAGPFGGDGEKRGMLVFDLKDAAEVERLSQQDPAVKAGRLKFEVLPWWAAKGSTLK